MKKLPLLLCTAMALSNSAYAQFNSDAPWAKDSKLTLAEKSQQFEEYWKASPSNKSEVRDQNAKGSGYKPFKRSEHHWKDYLMADGTIAPVENLWKSWAEKKELEKKESNFKTSEIGQWVPKGPYSHTGNGSWSPGQGRVNTIIIDPNNEDILYAGAPAGGIWKSTDRGINWTPLTDNLPQIGVSGIAIDPENSDIIYIATGDDDAGDSYSVGVWKSTDGGASWANTGDIDAISMNEIYIHPTNSSILWVATKSGVFKTTNAGTSWTKVLSQSIIDLKVKPSDPNTLYASSNSRFYKSTDGGDSFTESMSGLPNSSNKIVIDITPANSNVVYALSTDSSGGFQGIYKSTDSGDSFVRKNETQDIFRSQQSWYDLAFGVSDTDENTLFVGVLNIWKSTNGGDSFSQINNWSSPNQPSYTHADIHFLRYFNGKLFAGTDGGIYKSSDDGSVFTDLTENMMISQFYRISVAKQDSEKIVGGLQDNGGYGHTDNSWNNYHGADGMDCAVDATNKNTYYGFIQQGQQLYKSTDGGQSSQRIAHGPVAANWVTPLVSNSQGEIYAGYGNLYQLNGDHFTPVSNHNFATYLSLIEIASNDDNIIYVSDGYRLHKSVDKGVTFETLASPFNNSKISSVEIHNTNTDILWLTTSGWDGQIYKSIDAGATWTNIGSNIPSGSKNIVKHQENSPNNSIYVGTNLGVYYLDDLSSDWQAFSENLPNVKVTDLEISIEDAIITASTYGRGVWQSEIATILPQNDVKFIRVLTMGGDISCGSISPTIQVTNRGENTIENLRINYSAGGVNQSIDWTGSLNYEDVADINLPTINLPIGNHSFSTEIVLDNDSNLSNNTSETLNVLVNASQDVNYTHTFGDLNDDQWLTEESQSLWEKGITNTDNLKNLTDNAYTTNLTGKYHDDVVSHLISPCYDLSNIDNPVLKFNMAFDIEEDYDTLYMEYSTDQGTSWIVLGTAQDANWYNSNSNYIENHYNPLMQGRQWTGKDAELKEYSYDLADFANQSNILFRFTFKSDTNTNGDGVIIDNFVIEGAEEVLSTEIIALEGLNIYPNPSQGIFHIQRDSKESMDVKIFDVAGRLIRDFKNITENNYTINLENAPKGVYFYQIKVANKVSSDKIIIQ